MKLTLTGAWKTDTGLSSIATVTFGEHALDYVVDLNEHLEVVTTTGTFVAEAGEENEGAVNRSAFASWQNS